MRIVVDLQACQSQPHRDRGIGRYAMALTEAMLRQARNDEIWIALNGAVGDTIEPLRAAFSGLIDERRIVVWESIPDTAWSDTDNGWRHAAAGHIREAFLAQLKPDVVHVTSLFEGYMDATVATIGQDSPFLTAVTLYDLIPLVYGDTYLADARVHDWYFGKLEELKRAHLLLGISAHTCRAAVDRLGVPADRVVNVRAAVAPRFRPCTIDPEHAHRLLSRLGISRRFLMYTGGFDYRKNMQGLVRAYASLPDALRRTCQLVLVCHAPASARDSLLDLGCQSGLGDDELVLAGHVGDAELVELYSLCHALIFPSLHEGFGLPVLEAMSCGAAVIGSDVSSIPEVIGREDALFDPRDPAAIARKLHDVLTDDAFRRSLQQHGLRQSKLFSWDDCARRALGAMREARAQCSAQARNATVTVQSAKKDKPLLAYVSPLPPERSGVADYSVELLPALAEFYRIEAISDQPEIDDPWLRVHVPLRSSAWFQQHADDYDRVLYHISNGGLHADMLEMLARHPGTVVLHEIFLSGITSHLEWAGKVPGYWTRSLYESHGYAGLLARAAIGDPERVLEQYPCSLTVIRDADGVIVHSQFCCELADSWYGPGTSHDWAVIPHLRALPDPRDRAEVRRNLGLADEEWLVCCFGILGPYKCNREIIEGWLASDLANRKECHLVFVGGAHDEAYADELEALIAGHDMQTNIVITGWVDRQTYRDYLAAADCAVQMRRASRGEASGTVLDCMAYGIPTVVNAHGPFNELPSDALLKVEDAFTTRDLAGALDAIATDRQMRDRLGESARAFCANALDPARVAALYHDAIESAPDGPRHAVAKLARKIAALDVSPGLALEDSQRLAVAIAANQRRHFGKRQLLVDISELVRRDAGSGIQRVVKSVLDVLLRQPPEDFRVEPVYADPGQRYRYARGFTARFLGLAETMPADEPIDTDPGDVLLGLDLALDEIPANRSELESMRRRGVKLYFVVYDQLPLLRPDCFPPHAYALFNSWVNALARVGDGLVCISRAVEEELHLHLDTLQVPRARPLALGHFHLGADVDSGEPGADLTPAQQACMERLREAPSFLIVGTIEPRKGHAQTLDAFESLWAEGSSVVLVMVGKPGWMTEKLVERIRGHVEMGERLFWFERAGDGWLLCLYASCSALLAPSEGEGFGLPLIEAAKHGLPILCRDLSVFREVAGEHASYFSGFDGVDLATAIQEWLTLHEGGKTPVSGAMVWFDWEQSTRRLLEVVLGDSWDGWWMPGRHYWSAAHDPHGYLTGGYRERGRVVLVGDESGRMQTAAIAIPCGCYRMRLYGKWLGAHGTARVELVAGEGSQVIAGFEFATAAPARGELLFDSPVDIVDGCVLAIRVTVSAGGRLEIIGCGLQPVCTDVQKSGACEDREPEAAMTVRGIDRRAASSVATVEGPVRP